MTAFPNLRPFWYVMALIGAILPYYFFLPWALEAPENVGLFLQQATLNPASMTVAADILWAAFAFSLYVGILVARTRQWSLLVTILLTWTIGLSCGLPLLLAMRH